MWACCRPSASARRPRGRKSAIAWRPGKRPISRYKHVHAVAVRQVTVQAARRAIAAWPVALSLVVYAVVMLAAIVAFAPLGIVGGFLLGLVAAACWSSYLELLSQAVSGAKIASAGTTSSARSSCGCGTSSA